MIKVCGEKITATLRIICEESLRKGKSPETRKKAKIVSVHKNR